MTTTRRRRVCSAAAARTGPDSRVSARAMLPLYFGPPDRPLFGAFHSSSKAVASDVWQSLPRGAAVVLCSPFGHEEHHAHRSERHLAELLARAGFPVLRFDYDATGDSAGDDREGGRVEAWRASIVH